MAEHCLGMSNVCNCEVVGRDVKLKLRTTEVWEKTLRENGSMTILICESIDGVVSVLCHYTCITRVVRTAGGDRSLESPLGGNNEPGHC